MSKEGQFPPPGPGHCWLVRGRVQRVGFRAATRRKAVSLGLAGHARNLPDGRVEVVAAGAADALDRLRRWLTHGPALARVDAVEDGGQREVSGHGFSTG